MKLAPIKTLEDSANTNPLILSADIPLYDSFQLPLSIAIILKLKTPKPYFSTCKQTTLAISSYHHFFLSLFTKLSSYLDGVETEFEAARNCVELGEGADLRGGRKMMSARRER
jgi:hypothetical protein